MKDNVRLMEIDAEQAPIPERVAGAALAPPQPPPAIAAEIAGDAGPDDDDGAPPPPFAAAAGDMELIAGDEALAGGIMEHMTAEILGCRVIRDAMRRGQARFAGAKVVCPKHARCTKFRTFALDVDVWGVRACEGFLGAWLQGPPPEVEVRHQAWKPGPEHIQAYFDGLP